MTGTLSGDRLEANPSPYVALILLWILFGWMGVAMAKERVEVTAIKDNQKTQITREKVVRSDEEWKKILSPEEFTVTRKKGTERAFSGKYWNSKEKGIYRCVGCGNDLFSSEKKFDSGTGWPSFWEPVASENIKTKDDRSLFMHRIEVLCSVCGAHLGHIFNDGPPPTGERYCINSAALKLEKK